MARLGLRITDEMEENLSTESARSHIPASELVRMALEEFLGKRGYTFTATMERGGWRGGRKDKKEKQAED
jgi:hypothetical protein